MTSFQEINSQLLDEFEQALKERRGIDHNFISIQMIETFIKEMRDNLTNKDDLFNKLRFKQEIKVPQPHTLNQSRSEKSKDEEKQPQKRSSDGEQKSQEQNVIQVKKAKQKEELKKQSMKQTEQQWELEYQMERQLTEKAREESHKSATLHISALYNIKTKKYISAKDQEQITLPLLIIKTQTEEFLFTDVQARLCKGDKNQALNLCLKESDNEQEEENEASFEKKMTLLKKMFDQ